MKIAPALAAVGFGLLAGALPASAQSVKIGTLTCKGGEGIGLVLGSKKSYNCRFNGINGQSEPYHASVTKIGLDIGITKETTMVWTVLAPSAHRPHVLAGNYVGAAADASVGIGAGAKVLVGGSKKSITLQPLSVQGQTGLNLAVGVAEMKLR